MAHSSLASVLVSREYFLSSKRLGFRCWRHSDLPLALALWTHPAVTRLIGGPLTVAAVEEKLRQQIELQDSFGIAYWPFFLLATGEHIGCAGLRPYHQTRGVYELGFHLLPASWNKGLATEAARALIAYAFSTLGACALFAGHHPENAASRRVLEKLRFRYTHDELYPPTGLLHPSYFLDAPGRA